MFYNRYLVTTFTDDCKEVLISEVDPSSLCDHTQCKLYIVSGFIVDLSVPEYVTDHYVATKKIPYWQVKNMHNAELTYHSGSVSDNRGSVWNLSRLEKVKREIIPIPMPKVRKGTELQFFGGSWEKYTTRGWVKVV